MGSNKHKADDRERSPESTLTEADKRLIDFLVKQAVKSCT